ncbi:prenyltransferase [Halolamina salifodinae]|uniref:4-hydroxybenzoate polyprenyltransferase n=1 Tax=Halolamina salifodinae TaxID=1202767 RepID=A0A8T4GYT5_9EURY|nr:prenyltransferase [Halolamina salifodinae]MBP1986278.1 4-hydroxybenzoate polyprenyltransferase [Halolamina salifodinae]
MLRYLLMLSRPRFWLYTAGPVLVGVAYAASSVAELLTPLPALLFVYFLLPANVYLYGVNDRFDREIDAENPKKESGPEARWRDSWGVTAVVAAAGLLGLALFPLTPTVTWPYLAGFFALATAYSAPPLRFKARPFLDSLSNGLYLLPGAAAYAALAGAHPPAAALVGGWLWTMGMHTYSAIPDIEPDRAAGIETTATLLGERRTYRYCGLCWTLAAVAFGLLDLRLGALLGVYPLFLLGTVGAGVDVDRAYWWFPVVNGVVGMLLTFGGLLRLVGVLG